MQSAGAAVPNPNSEIARLIQLLEEPPPGIYSARTSQILEGKLYRLACGCLRDEVELRTYHQLNNRTEKDPIECRRHGRASVAQEDPRMTATLQHWRDQLAKSGVSWQKSSLQTRSDKQADPTPTSPPTLRILPASPKPKPPTPPPAITASPTSAAASSHSPDSNESPASVLPIRKGPRIKEGPRPKIQNPVFTTSSVSLSSTDSTSCVSSINEKASPPRPVPALPPPAPPSPPPLQTTSKTPTRKREEEDEDTQSYNGKAPPSKKAKPDSDIPSAPPSTPATPKKSRRKKAESDDDNFSFSLNDFCLKKQTEN